MSPVGTMARVYEALKARVMAGVYTPGERIDPTRLSAELNASATPIRDALWRLTGERLVESWTQEGFRQPQLTEAQLRDLLSWRESVLLISLRSLERAGKRSDLALPEPSNDAELACTWVAELSSNAEHLEAYRAVSERLSVIRQVEGGVLSDQPKPDLLVLAVADERWRDARRWVGDDHRRRSKAAPALIAALNRLRR